MKNANWVKVDWTDTIVKPDKDDFRCGECAELKKSKLAYTTDNHKGVYICKDCAGVK